MQSSTNSKKILFLMTAFYGVLGAAFVLHWAFNLCPIHFGKFKKPIPVVYGLPIFEALIKAKRGEVVLGGCMVRSTSGACPYRHFPATFNFSSRFQMESVPRKGENEG
jgi:hypothetical protein